MEQRIIKFKAKRLDNGKWIKGYYYEECGNTYIIEDRQEKSMLNRNHPHQVDPFSVCQFVGLRDIEGNGIFENDLLTKDGTVVYKVGYVNCGFAASYEDEDDFSLNLLAIRKYCRICGNRFDRKEEK